MIQNYFTSWDAMCKMHPKQIYTVVQKTEKNPQQNGFLLGSITPSVCLKSNNFLSQQTSILLVLSEDRAIYNKLRTISEREQPRWTPRILVNSGERLPQARTLPLQFGYIDWMTEKNYSGTCFSGRRRQNCTIDRVECHCKVKEDRKYGSVKLRSLF